MQFKWHPDEPPPELESHSKAKLTVLRSYLRAYFRRLNVNPQRDTFRLDLIDGFAGGGLFRDGTQTVSGTPFIMLEEAADAHTVLNERRMKPLEVDCQFYFVDKEPAHTDHLRKTLRDRGYDLDHGNIVVRTGLFEDEAERIVSSVRQRQPRAGRAIFLLDQTGSAARFSDYDEVTLQLVREGELEILSADGRARSRSLRHLRPTDRIALPSTLQLPGISRFPRNRS